MKNIFISHSSKDKKIVDCVVNLLTKIGYGNENLFCTSKIEFGIKSSNNYLNNEIIKEFESSEIIIYIITENFLSSAYCIQELGFMISYNKKSYIIKKTNIPKEKIKGFVNSNNHFYNFDIESLKKILSLILKENNLFENLNNEIEHYLNEINFDELNKTSLSTINKDEKYYIFFKKIASNKELSIISEIYFSNSRKLSYACHDEDIINLVNEGVIEMIIGTIQYDNPFSEYRKQIATYKITNDVLIFIDENNEIYKKITNFKNK